jgi:hypothetical protein
VEAALGFAFPKAKLESKFPPAQPCCWVTSPLAYLRGPWCNWQHVSLSSFKVRVRIPSGPPFFPVLVGKIWRGVSGQGDSSSNLDFRLFGCDSVIEAGQAYGPEWKTRSGFCFFPLLQSNERVLRQIAVLNTSGGYESLFAGKSLQFWRKCIGYRVVLEVDVVQFLRPLRHW